ncbi:MAG: sugar phosphate isomerase/epimerase [Limisphaerales bacterium]|jgi:sugar phosphate isomerase/epimerase
MSLDLGFDNYAIRGFRWNAEQLLDYAVNLKVSHLFLSDLGVFRRNTEGALREFRSRAHELGLSIHVGTLSVCPGSVMFDRSKGSAENQLRETIRIAKAVGSPVARCVLGRIEDRYSDGGIQARMEETLRVFEAVRSQARDSGVKIGIENHAGDMRASEVLQLIKAAGSDYVGAVFDAGNALWALENPLEALETLGPYTVSTGFRDSNVWISEGGATLQWTAMGEGLVDWKKFFRRYVELCPKVPVIIETISGRPIPIVFCKESFWKGYRDLSAEDFVKFMVTANCGEPIPGLPARMAARASRDHQRSELEQSLEFCRRLFPRLGLKSIRRKMS